jgi:hypothetical protein
MKLKVLFRYRSNLAQYEAGTVIDVDLETAKFLDRDAPGCFEVFESEPEPETKELDQPPADKMIDQEKTGRGRPKTK